MQLSSGNVHSFISGSIEANKPRLVLFSPHSHPSLLYKAVAFSNQPVAEFGFVSTEKATGKSLEVLEQFGVSWKMKKLMVFKEYPTPSVVVEVCVCVCVVNMTVVSRPLSLSFCTGASVNW